MENEQRGEFSVDVNKLVQCLRIRTETLETVSDKCCIYNVSPRYRELNEKAYTPAVVSIGPFHHGKEEYRVMEEYKGRYLVDFLKRCGLSLEEYIQSISKLEMALRNSYAQLTQHSKEEFMEIMAVDGAFLLEYFLKRNFEDWSSSDRIRHRQRLVLDVRYDILMMENQLPFVLLESLFKLLEMSNANGGISLTKMVVEALTGTTGWNLLETGNIVIGEVNHLIDLLGVCMQPSLDQEPGICLSAPSISELHRAGVKFKPISSKSLYDLKFDNGILEIPKLKLAERSGIILSNMLAYEQCHTSYNYMNDYIFIMDMLINSPEDVELLVQNGCIENWLQDDAAVAAMINGLGKICVVWTKEYCYGGLIRDLNAYCKSPWHKWKATLKQKYFNNPWTIVSVIAATFLLLLTVMQTVFSALQIV